MLAVSYQGRSIRDVFEATADEAAVLFAQCEPAVKKLRLLQEVGLGYLQLGQTLTTLSGGEAQRLKLAKELSLSRPGRQTLYLMDEPTAGLHSQDVEQFLTLLDRIVAAGGTVVVAEHNPQLLRNSDFIIELGPAGGEKGGYLLFEGTPEEIKACGKSVTAAYL